jgi:hypothetical protein
MCRTGTQCGGPKGIENPRVGGSIPPLGTIFLSKLSIVGITPVVRRNSAGIEPHVVRWAEHIHVLRAAPSSKYELPKFVPDEFVRLWAPSFKGSQCDCGPFLFLPPASRRCWLFAKWKGLFRRPTWSHSPALFRSFCEPPRAPDRVLRSIPGPGSLRIWCAIPPTTINRNLSISIPKNCSSLPFPVFLRTYAKQALRLAVPSSTLA